MPTSADLAFRQTVQESLAKLDTRVAEALSSLIEHRYPPEVFALSFEVFSEGFTSGFPVRAFFVDRSNTEHFIVEGGEAKYPSPVDPGILELESVYPEEVEEQLAANSDSDAWEIATEELIRWFAKQWEDAGGASFPLVATIAHHDASEEFNLKSKSWQSSYAAFDL